MLYTDGMGLYIGQQEDRRTELQQRIAADLRAKAEQKSKLEAEPRDAIEDSAFIQGTKRTTTLAPVWLLIFFASIIVFIYFITQVNGT